MLTHKLATLQKPRRLVVLGSGGFVGDAVVKEAEKSLINILRIGSQDIDLTEDNAAHKLRKILQPQDCVVFAAAIDQGHASGSGALLKNLAMARNVAETISCVSNAHLIYLSSDAVYAPDVSLLHEQSPAAPATIYGAMHRAREILLEAEAKIPLAVLRLTAIYGADDTHNAYGPNRFMREALQKKKITLFGAGEEMRDHLYVDDVARLIVATSCHQSTGLLNLVSGTAVSFLDLATRIASMVGARIEHVPRRIAITHKHHDSTARIVAFPSILPMPLETGLTHMLKNLQR